MQKLILEKPKNSMRYIIKDSFGDTIYLLGYCIIDLWVERINDNVKWALDPEEWYGSMNVATLEKENNYILIGSQISDEPDGGPFFKISINEFVKLLPQWKRLVEEGVQEITIIENNDHKLEITGEKYPI